MISRSTVRAPLRWTALLALVLLLGACYPAPQHPPSAVRFEDPSSVSVLDGCVRQEPDLDLYAPSPYVFTGALRYYKPAVASLHQRLDEIERQSQKRGLFLHHVCSAIYGSGFIRQNFVGNDLDEVVCVHLGDLSIDAANPGVAAEEVMGRIETYLQVFYGVFRRASADDLALLNFRLLKDNRMKNRDLLLEKMTASLRDVAANRPHRVLVPSLSGLLKPAVLGPDESYIYETTRIQLVSDRIRSIDWMYSGIREYQVMCHWFVDAKITSGGKTLREIPNMEFRPTFVPSGDVLSLNDTLLGMVPVGRESAVFLSELVREERPRLAGERLWLASRLLSEVDRNAAGGDTLKALKRLQQACDALAPDLDPATIRTISDKVAARLGNDDALLCDEIAECAESGMNVLKDFNLLGIYQDSFDLQRLIIHASQNASLVARRHPELQDAAEKLDLEGRAMNEALQGGFPSEQGRELLKKGFEDFSKFGKECLAANMPPKEEVAGLGEMLKARLRQCGRVPLPVYGLPDGSLGVIAEDLKAAGALQDLTKGLQELGAPAFEYSLITRGKIPLDRNSKPQPVSAVYWIAKENTTDVEKTSTQRLMQALDRDVNRFSWPPSTGLVQLRRAAQDRFLERFGEAGAKAWAQTRTGGEGLLALLGVADPAAADSLLERHLSIVEGASGAAAVLPSFEDTGDQIDRALAAALATTSERILLGLAVARASTDKRGMDVDRARAAQEQLLDLICALRDVAGKQASFDSVRDTPSGTEYLVQCRGSGEKLIVSVNTQGGDGGQTRIAFTVQEKGGKVTPDPLLLRLDQSSRLGAAFDLQFSLSRTDWGVHGPLAFDPSIPDHHFPDDIPFAIDRQFSPKDKHAAAERFTRYIKERFLQEVLGGIGAPLPAPSASPQTQLSTGP